MPTTEAPAKAKYKETWKDWMPEGAPEPPDLQTREDVVEWIGRQQGAGMRPITAGDIAYWEGIGVLPRGVRRWHEGSAKALYPGWYWLLARQVRSLQHAGLSLDEIRPRIRTHARLMLSFPPAPENSRHWPPGARSPEDIQLWPDLTTELERLARWVATQTGVPTERVEVHVIGTNGHATKFAVPISPSNPGEDLPKDT